MSDVVTSNPISLRDALAAWDRETKARTFGEVLSERAEIMTAIIVAAREAVTENARLTELLRICEAKAIPHETECDCCGATEGRHWSDCILVSPRPATSTAPHYEHKPECPAARDMPVGLWVCTCSAEKSAVEPERDSDETFFNRDDGTQRMTPIESIIGKMRSWLADEEAKAKIPQGAARILAFPEDDVRTLLKHLDDLRGTAALVHGGGVSSLGGKITDIDMAKEAEKLKT